MTIRRPAASFAASIGIAVPAACAASDTANTTVAAVVPLPLWKGELFLGSDLVQPVVGTTQFNRREDKSE